MTTYPATAHSAAHAACAAVPSNCRGRREAASVPTAAAPQPKAICRAKGALARRAARRTSRIQSRSINEPPRANIDPLPRHPATPGPTPLEILKRELASHGSNAESNFAGMRVFDSVADELPGFAKPPSPRTPWYLSSATLPWPSSLARGPYGWAQVATSVITGSLIVVLAIAVRDHQLDRAGDLGLPGDHCGSRRVLTISWQIMINLRFSLWETRRR